MKERKSWIDGLRALAMLFVMYGHLCTGIRPYSVFSAPVKLPLFFAGQPGLLGRRRLRKGLLRLPPLCLLILREAIDRLLRGSIETPLRLILLHSCILLSILKVGHITSTPIIIRQNTAIFHP